MEAELALYDSKRIGKDLADVFLNFFVELLGTYRSFIRETEFDKEGFIDSQPTWEAKQVNFLVLLRFFILHLTHG